MKGKTNVVQIETWEELIAALQEKYTLPLSEACEILKASRSWINKYIRPHVPAVYISSGIINGRQRGPSWTRLASKILGKEITDQIWLDRSEFESFIRDSIVSCTAQSKFVPYTTLVRPDLLSYFESEYDRITAAISSAAMQMQRIEVTNLSVELDKLIKDCITGRTEKEMLQKKLDASHRGGIVAWPIPYPDVSASEWMAVHDLKGYAGVDETIYRRLFTEGAYRIEIQVPALTGELSKKVYYIADPEPLTTTFTDGIIVPIQLWDFYKSI